MGHESSNLSWRITPRPWTGRWPCEGWMGGSIPPGGTSVRQDRWSVRLPVTQETTGSSPVRTAQLLAGGSGLGTSNPDGSVRFAVGGLKGASSSGQDPGLWTQSPRFESECSLSLRVSVTAARRSLEPRGLGSNPRHAASEDWCNGNMSVSKTVRSGFESLILRSCAGSLDTLSAWTKESSGCTLTCGSPAVSLRLASSLIRTHDVGSIPTAAMPRCWNATALLRPAQRVRFSPGLSR